MSAKFKGQRQWIREVLNKFEELEKSQPEPLNRDPEWPEWVFNLLVIISGVSYPGLKLKNLKKWKAKDLGRFLGRHYANGCLLINQVPLSSQVIHEREKGFAGLGKLILQKRPNVDLNKSKKECEPEMQIWLSKFTEFMQEALSSACERPYVEASAFFEAFGKAIVIKPDDLLTERTMGVGDKICWTMFVMWQDIERLESVAQLHRLFEKVLKPRGIVLKYKRIEKLCNRIKLKFKGPGRPPGSKNPDKL